MGGELLADGENLSSVPRVNRQHLHKAVISEITVTDTIPSLHYEPVACQSTDCLLCLGLDSGYLSCLTPEVKDIRGSFKLEQRNLKGQVFNLRKEMHCFSCVCVCVCDWFGTVAFDIQGRCNVTS